MEGKMMKKGYTIGLDIGTNSVGFSVITDDYRLVSKKMKVFGNTERKAIKKNFWGARLFDEGKTAQERRIKRTSRRRIRRRKNRILYLQEIFLPMITDVDNYFFQRLNESFLVEEDAQFDKHPVFGSLEEELAFHQTYPTIYHLRKELADNEEQADIRLVYLAIAHILKYRGHFLIEGKLDTENSSVQQLLVNFIQVYNQTFSALPAIDSQLAISDILTSSKSKSQKVDSVIQSIQTEKTNGTFAQFIKLIVGNQGNFKTTFLAAEDLKIQFSDELYEENLEQLLAMIGDEYADVFTVAYKLYQAILLNGILSSHEVITTNAKLSTAMIQRYENHKQDLSKLKQFIKENQPDKYYELFKDKTKDGYAGYIEGKTKEVAFYKYLKKILDNISGSEYFLEKIEQENFLRKQRTYDNGVIPHQIHGHELQAIIQNQAKFYPILKENQQKIETIFNFRIPYYIGPLEVNDEQNPFSWVKRKAPGKIRPWNMEELVDKSASAKTFIERMTLKDTYIQENVLPKHSLIYEKYMIFNELTKVSYIDDRGLKQKFTAVEKATIFEKLFKQEHRVTEKQLIHLLKNEWMIENPTIEGVDTKFNATYLTYLDLKKIDGLVEYLEDETKEDIIEELIKILTIFEDRRMITEQLKKLPIELDDKTIKELSRKKYNGWGRLSKKLIYEIKDQHTQKTILDYLMEDESNTTILNRNFMQLVNDDSLSFKKIIADYQTVEETVGLNEIVAELPGSPAIKKGILQSLKIVDELVSIMGYLPKNIVVEMARENQTTTQGKNNSKPRLKTLEKALKGFSDNVLDKHKTDNRQLQNDRLYLYYLQNGKDIYTGTELDIDYLSQYDIDHIIPQSFITDNSLDNRVLTSSKENRGKLDNVPSKEVVQRQKYYWQQLHKAKLMSDKKLANLMKAEVSGGLTDNDKAGFIQRQLVETRQITKHVANILDKRFNGESSNVSEKKVQIITLKSVLVSEFRKAFDLYKIREMNDFHHAHDAYLNAVVGITLLRVYPQLKSEFVYGEYSTNNIHVKNRATAKKQLYSNIMKFFQYKEQISNDDGEILWNKKMAISQIKKVLASHQVNVVKKVEIQNGGFSKETILPKGNSTKLIPRKNHLDPVKYGGLDSPTTAYSIIIEFEKGAKKKIAKQLVGITIQEREIFEKDRLEYLDKKGYTNPKILAIAPKYTLFEMKNGHRRLLSSASESQKGNQLIVPDSFIPLLYHSKKISNNRKEGESMTYVMHHRKQFDELLDYILTFANHYILADKNSEKIQQAYAKYKNSATIQELATSFINLLTYTSMGAPSDFDFLGEKIARKRYTTVTELLHSVIIYQSITGLYETRINLAGE